MGHGETDIPKKGEGEGRGWGDRKGEPLETESRLLVEGMKPVCSLNTQTRLMGLSKRTKRLGQNKKMEGGAGCTLSKNDNTKFSDIQRARA